MNPFYVWLLIGFWALTAAAFFEWGRKHRDNEIAGLWRKNRCRECGAEPRPIIRHISGCEADWPDAANLPLPGDDG